MHLALVTANWFDSHQYLALWIEGIALVFIFGLDWLVYRKSVAERREQHKESVAQMDEMRRQADLIAGQNALLKESVSVAKDGAEAAKANAQAAILNAQAVINSERPWIVMSVGPHYSNPSNCVFTATNKGRTPAEFESGTIDFSFDSDPATLTSHPPYASRMIAPDRDLIAQDDGFDLNLTGVNPEAMIENAGMTERMKIGNQFLIVYGRIIYKDVFSRDGQEATHHETRFCYSFDVARRTFVRTGPEEYNRYT